MSIFRFRTPVSRHTHVRSTIWMPATAMVLFMSIYLPLASMLVQASSPQTTVVAATPKTAANPVSTGNTAATVNPVVVPAVAKSAVVVSNCTPLSFGMPSGIPLNAAAVGLSVQTDAPTQYQIYGNSAFQLRTQIQHCAPGANGSTSAEFTALTSYNLTWQYDTAVGDSCSITNVKVGMHTAMALPYWQPTGTAATGLAGRWQSFMTSLTTHEQGHATLDKLYAGKLLDDLHAMGSVDCSTLSATIKTIVNNDVGALNQANDAYDAQTNHGATQGAVLPTY